MIIRFLDKHDRCCQITTPNTNILVYMTEEEKQQLIQSERSQCLMLIDARESAERQQRIVQLLNTKDDPLEMK